MKSYCYNNEIAYQDMSNIELQANPSLLSFLKIVSEKGHFVGKKILDLGCGLGVMTPHLARLSNSVFGVDISQSAITLAQNSYPQGKFQCADILYDDFGNDYGLVFDSHTIHTIVFDDEREKLFKKIYDALAPQGVFALETMVGHDELVLSGRYILDKDYHLWKRVVSDRYHGIDMHDGEQVIPYRRLLLSHMIEKELTDAGFKIIYLIVSGAQKIVIDDDWPFASQSDPDRMRAICVKES